MRKNWWIWVCDWFILFKSERSHTGLNKKVCLNVLLNIQLSKIEEYKRVYISFHNKFEWDIFLPSLGQNKNSPKSHLQGHIPKIKPWHPVCWVC